MAEDKDENKSVSTETSQESKADPNDGKPSEDTSSAKEPKPTEDSSPAKLAESSESETMPVAATATATAATNADSSNESDAEAVENAKRENRRSAVRIAVTYIAAGFLFLVGAAVVGYLLAIGDIATGKDIFLTILPVAAAIVTYWYAGRKGDESAVKIIEAMRKEIK